MTRPAARALVVAALAEEVAHVSGVEVLVTGVGKAGAAAALTARLSAGPIPSVVINVGTAGSLDPSLAGLIEVDVVTQHDFPYDVIRALVGDAPARAYQLRTDAPPQPIDAWSEASVVVGTGDVFVADAAQASQLAGSGVRLVDMEAYAYAASCAAAGVPMRCVKAVSDFADADAGLSWLDTIDGCAQALADWVAAHVHDS